MLSYQSLQFVTKLTVVFLMSTFTGMYKLDANINDYYALLMHRNLL